MRKWYMVRTTELTPNEHLSNLLEEEHWDDALAVAHQYQLTTDDVYK